MCYLGVVVFYLPCGGLCEVLDFIQWRYNSKRHWLIIDCAKDMALDSICHPFQFA